GWVALAERFGRLGLEACLADAIDAAERGFAVGARTAASWAAAAEPGELWPPTSVPPELMPPPAPGEYVRLPELAASLGTMAEGAAAGFCGGAVAEATAPASWLDPDALTPPRPRGVEPLSGGYRGYEVVELPPPTQGVAVLEGLALLEGFEPVLGNQ